MNVEEVLRGRVTVKLLTETYVFTYRGEKNGGTGDKGKPREGV